MPSSPPVATKLKKRMYTGTALCPKPFKDPRLVYDRVLLVTPKIAERMLELNKRNRGRKSRAVNTYAEDIAEGRWNPKAGHLYFVTDGKRWYLTEGANRLRAAIEADESVEMQIQYSYDEPLQFLFCVDTGAKRTPRDDVEILKRARLIRSKCTPAEIAATAGYFSSTRGRGLAAWACVLDKDFELLMKVLPPKDFPPAIRGAALRLLRNPEPVELTKGQILTGLRRWGRIVRDPVSVERTAANSYALAFAQWLFNAESMKHGGGKNQRPITRAALRSMVGFLNNETYPGTTKLKVNLLLTGIWPLHGSQNGKKPTVKEVLDLVPITSQDHLRMRRKMVKLSTGNH